MAHVFFIPNGLILGLSVANEDEAAWDRRLDELMAFANAEFGYWIGECPPYDTVPEFVAAARAGGRHRDRSAAPRSGDLA